MKIKLMPSCVWLEVGQGAVPRPKVSTYLVHAHTEATHESESKMKVT